jgi:hypothetical protein
VLDFALEAAAFLGVRLIIPFINMVDSPNWGGAATMCRITDTAPTEFFTSSKTRDLYKNLIRDIITRKNTITGADTLFGSMGFFALVRSMLSFI